MMKKVTRGAEAVLFTGTRCSAGEVCIKLEPTIFDRSFNIVIAVRRAVWIVNFFYGYDIC